MSRIQPRVHVAIGAVTVCLLCCAPAVLAQDVTEPSLRAAFIHSFVRFTEWPQDVLAPGAPLVLCVLGDAALSDVLGNYVKGLSVDGHNIVVSHVAEGMLRSCHLLYVSGMPVKKAALVAAGLNAAPVLTLSDMDHFSQLGGIAQIYVEDGRMRIKVNLNAARRAHLLISSKLLSLATIVVDDPNASPR